MTDQNVQPPADVPFLNNIPVAALAGMAFSTLATLGLQVPDNVKAAVVMAVQGIAGLIVIYLHYRNHKTKVALVANAQATGAQK